MRERQDASDVYVRICEADLVRIPEFVALAKKYNPEFSVTTYSGEYKDLEERCVWIGGVGHVAPELPLEAVQEFLVKHMDAHPDKPVEILVQDDVQEFEQRTVDGLLVKCKRFVGFHKSFKSWDDYAEIAALGGGNREIEGEDE